MNSNAVRRGSIEVYMPSKTGTRPQYDLPTAVTFMLAGLVLGSIITVLFSPLTDECAIRFPWFRAPSRSADRLD
jgi:hypothetical protein